MRQINIHQEVNVYEPHARPSGGYPGLFLLCFVLLPLAVAAIAAVILGAWVLEAVIALIAGAIDLIFMAVDGLFSALPAIGTGLLTLFVMAIEGVIAALPVLGGIVVVGLGGWATIALARHFIPLWQRRQQRPQYQVVPPERPTLIVINAGPSLTSEQITHLLAEQNVAVGDIRCRMASESS